MGIVDLVRPLAEYLLPLIFFGSFAVAGAAIYFNDDRRVRKTFAVGFVVVLLLFQTSIIPLTVPPFTTWHKFSETWEQERIEYEFRVVDAEGNELRYDPKATLSFHGVRMATVENRMTSEYSEQKQREVATFLLDSAREYRTEVERNRPRRGFVWTDGGVRPHQLLAFPAHGHTGAWTAETTDDYSEFVGVRLYRMTIETSDDGSEVVSHSEELVYEYTDQNATATDANAALEARYVR